MLLISSNGQNCFDKNRYAIKKIVQSLRFRLTLWNTIVVLLACLLALFTVREAMRLTMEKEARTLLEEELVELELAIRQLYPNQERIDGEFERKVLSHSQHNWFAALFDENDRPIWKSKNFPKNVISQSVNQTGRSNQLLVVQQVIVVPDQSQLTIVIGEPTEFIEDDIWRLTKIMLYIGAALVVISPLGGYLLARRATSPVREIINTTRSLDPAHLNSRLTIRQTGDELDQISIEINSFLDQIAEYIESQREFVANAAHELRSPITAIQTSVDVTLDKPRNTEEYQDELETVSEQCQQLRHLVNQLLELAETDAGVRSRLFERVNLTELINKSVSVFSGVAEERNIVLESQLEPDIWISGDPPKLHQVINNLLDNALKFSPSNSRVSVQLFELDNRACLVVKDAGPGVPDEMLGRIFDRFFQVDQSRQRDAMRGNGLGLSICKSIVRQHKGRIDARNLESGLGVFVEFGSTTD